MSVFQARQLRRTMTPPERILWRLLRERPNGFKFRRQHPLGPYVLDFYCHGSLLAIEIDGYGHQLGDNPERDARRDKWVARQGIVTLRIDASNIRDNLEGVLNLILERCAERTPPPPAAVPLPSNSRGGR
ncbi:MAG: endonuclease domain-containing protein [Pseudomonadota bacterium]|nr:endonuclease domain-containing protein [Pseudomonadota bacterium]